MADDPEIQAFFDDGGETTKHADGYSQVDSAQPNYSLEDGWRWDDDETAAAEHDDTIYAMVDSQALPNQFPIVYFDDYFEGDNYEEPDVNDFEWSGPIQPNAPPAPYISDPDIDFDEGHETHTHALDYQQLDAPNFPQNTPEDPWEWDSEQATDDDYPGPFPEDSVGANAPAGVTIVLEDAIDPNEDDVDDDIIDHFTNYDTAQPSYDDAWDWDSEQDPDDEFASSFVPDPTNVNASLVTIGYDDPYDYDQDEGYEEDLPPEPPLAPPGPAFTYQDEWDWELDLYEDPTEADFPQDVVGANAPVVVTVTYQDEWSFDEDDVTSSAGVDTYLQSDSTAGAASITFNDEWDFDSEFPAPDGWVESYIQADNTSVATAVLAFTDDAASQDDEPEDFFADHFGNVNLDQPVYDDAWDWDETVEDDFPNEPVGSNAPIFVGVVYDDAWDHWQDDAEEFQQDDAFQEINLPPAAGLQFQDEDFSTWDDDGTDDYETDAALEPPPVGVLPVSGFKITIPYRTFAVATPVRPFVINIPYRIFTLNGTQPGIPGFIPVAPPSADSTSVTADTTQITTDE